MLDLEEAARFLGQNGWLTSTTPSFRAAMLSRAVLRTYDRNLDLFHIGDEPGGLWGLAEGALLVDFPGPDDSPSVVHYARPGFWTGEASVITGGSRVIGLRTARPSTLLRVTRTAFLDIAVTDPQAWRWIARLSLDHTLTLLRHNLDLRIPISRRKVASILCHMSGGDAGPVPTDKIEIDISQEQLADFCGISRAALAEALRDFAAQGLVGLGYRRIIVNDLAGLARIGTAAT
jgi:hypothetical protein